ncbi:hypothetical protein GCM10027416_25920 [Okibacterium endophyticum]
MDADSGTPHTRTDPASAHTGPSAAHRWGIVDAVCWLALALALSWMLGFPVVQLAIGSPILVTALSFVVVWVVLGAGVLVATFARGNRSLVRDFGLRFSWIDLLWGAGLGLVLRAVATLIEITVYGGTPGGAASFGATPLLWAIVFAAAGAVVSPLVEELFFRGLMLRAVLKSSTGSPTSASVIAVGVSAIAFALVHALQLQPGGGMIVVGLSTLIVGVALGALALFTGRLGGAIIAHIVFNATALITIG